MLSSSQQATSSQQLALALFRLLLNFLVHCTAPPSRLRAGFRLVHALAALRSSRLLTSLTATLAEPAFRMMEQQAIYDFLGELQIENYRARDEDADVWILQFLEEGPQDEANPTDYLSDDLAPSPLMDANAYHQTEPRMLMLTGRRGTRKRRTSPWDPMFFPRHVSRDPEYTSRKNNARWTAEEVERLVQGVTKFGVGRWTKVKENFFKRPIRTAVNLKDKWRNLVKAYEEGSQRTTQLRLKPSLVEQIRKLAAKKPYANKRHR